MTLLCDIAQYLQMGNCLAADNEMRLVNGHIPIRFVGG